MRSGWLVSANAGQSAAGQHLPADQHINGNRLQVSHRNSSNVPTMAGLIAPEFRLKVGFVFGPEAVRSDNV